MAATFVGVGVKMAEAADAEERGDLEAGKRIAGEALKLFAVLAASMDDAKVGAELAVQANVAYQAALHDADAEFAPDAGTASGAVWTSRPGGLAARSGGVRGEALRRSPRTIRVIAFNFHRSRTVAEAQTEANGAITAVADLAKTVLGKPGKRPIGPFQIIGRLLLGLVAISASLASVSGYIDSLPRSEKLLEVSRSTVSLRYFAGGGIAALIAFCIVLTIILAIRHPLYLSNVSDLSEEAQNLLSKPTIKGQNAPSEPLEIKPPRRPAADG